MLGSTSSPTTKPLKSVSSSSSSISEFSGSSAQAASFRINLSAETLGSAGLGEPDRLETCLLPSNLVDVETASPLDPDFGCLGRAFASRQSFESDNSRESTCVSPIDRMGGDLARPFFEETETSFPEPYLGRTGTLPRKTGRGVVREPFLTVVALLDFVGLVRVCMAVREKLEDDPRFAMTFGSCTFRGDDRRTTVLNVGGGRSVESSGSSSSDPVPIVAYEFLSY